MALRDELVRPQGVSEKGMRRAAAVAAWIERRAGSIVVAFLLVALASGWLTTRLRIDQELRRLLPDDFPSVVGIDRLSDEIAKALRAPEMVERLTKQGWEIAYGTPEQAAQTIRNDLVRWGPIVKASGARVD